MDDWASTLASGRSIVCLVQICYVWVLVLQGSVPKGGRTQEISRYLKVIDKPRPPRAIAKNYRVVTAGFLKSSSEMLNQQFGTFLVMIIYGFNFKFSLDALKTLKNEIKYFWRLQLTEKVTFQHWREKVDSVGYLKEEAQMESLTRILGYS